MATTTATEGNINRSAKNVAEQSNFNPIQTAPSPQFERTDKRPKAF